MNPSTNAPVGATFTILSFLDNPSGTKDSSFKPHSVKRHFDGEVFTIGDRVTNGTQMVGLVEEFSFLNGQVFVKTDWSGVGMNLDSLSKEPIVPSKFQIRQVVTLSFPEQNAKLDATVRAVHFHGGIQNSDGNYARERYDLDVWIGEGGNSSTRLYNVDVNLLTAR